MNLLRVRFDEIYRRHLCRHGQFGINLWHLLAVFGIYLSLLGIAAACVRAAASEVRPQVALLVLMLPYFAVLILNVPFRVFLMTLTIMLLLLWTYLQLPLIPVWGHLLLIFFWHRVQLWSHRRYSMHRDMSEFQEKYQKGARLFVLLSVYELPILVNYLLFGRRDWVF